MKEPFDQQHAALIFGPINCIFSMARKIGDIRSVHPIVCPNAQQEKVAAMAAKNIVERGAPTLFSRSQCSPPVIAG